MHACASGRREEEGAVRGMRFVAGSFAASAELVEAEGGAWAGCVEGGGERFAVAVAALGVAEGSVG